MKSSTRNQAIAMLMVAILVLLAFWWWTSRAPTKSFGVTQVVWANASPPTLQLTLATPADRQLYLGKRALIVFTPTPTTKTPLLLALQNYPFVIPAEGGIDGAGVTVNVGSLPKGVTNLPSQTLVIGGSLLGALQINLT